MKLPGYTLMGLGFLSFVATCVLMLWGPKDEAGHVFWWWYLLLVTSILLWAIGHRISRG